MPSCVTNNQDRRDRLHHTSLCPHARSACARRAPEPRRCNANRHRKDGAESVKHIYPDQQRYFQLRLLHGDSLQTVGRGSVHDVSDPADRALGDAFLVRIRDVPGTWKGWMSWPIFSCSVILAISASARVRIASLNACGSAAAGLFTRPIITHSPKLSELMS